MNTPLDAAIQTEYLPGELYQRMFNRVLEKFPFLEKSGLRRLIYEHTGIKKETLRDYMEKNRVGVDRRAADFLGIVLDGAKNPHHKDLEERIRGMERVAHEEYTAIIDELVKITGRRKGTVYRVLSGILGVNQTTLLHAYGGRLRITREKHNKIKDIIHSRQYTALLPKIKKVDSRKYAAVISRLAKKTGYKRGSIYRVLSDKFGVSASTLYAWYRNDVADIPAEAYGKIRHAAAEMERDIIRHTTLPFVPVVAYRQLFDEVVRRYNISKGRLRHILHKQTGIEKITLKNYATKGVRYASREAAVLLQNLLADNRDWVNEDGNNRYGNNGLKKEVIECGRVGREEFVGLVDRLAEASGGTKNAVYNAISEEINLHPTILSRFYRGVRESYITRSAYGMAEALLKRVEEGSALRAGPPPFVPLEEAKPLYEKIQEMCGSRNDANRLIAAAAGKSASCIRQSLGGWRTKTKIRRELYESLQKIINAPEFDFSKSYDIGQAIYLGGRLRVVVSKPKKDCIEVMSSSGETAVYCENLPPHNPAYERKGDLFFAAAR